MAATNRVGKTTATLGIASAVIAAVAAYGSGFGLWHFTIAFLAIAVALVLAIVAVLGGVTTLIRRKPLGTSGIVGIIAALGFLGIMGYWINKGANSPPLHDVSTNLETPPAFTTLTLRADNLLGVDTVENWRALHAKAYGDIKPVTLAKPAPAAMAAIKSLVEARGWEVALATPERIEATETQSPFKFKDDVVIIATPSADAKSVQIDVRSVSRVGLSDLGLNADRVRALLTDIRAIK
jgi:uncharacterized protein (DUF1499 family)